MIHLTLADIEALGRIDRLTLINSITGYKPANVIGTCDASRHTNAAIISSVVHLGSDPPLIGFFMRPLVGERHTMENILSTRHYTINHVTAAMAERAHFTSAGFPKEISEFERCGLTPEWIFGFQAPFIAGSPVRIGLEMVENSEIKLNKTILVIGLVKHLFIEPSILEHDYHLNLDGAGTVCVSGLDTYHTVSQLARYPYARPENTPDFTESGE